jgi:tRNA(fMet)-specific endonuclease VapC
VPEYLLDTNFCSALIRETSKKAVLRLVEHAVTEIALSALTVAELEYGVAKSRQPKLNRGRLDTFLQPLQVLSFDDAAALAYGKARAKLETRGEMIGPIDMLIAAQALSLDLTVVTNNTAAFRRVEGLKIEDWTE